MLVQSVQPGRADVDGNNVRGRGGRLHIKGVGREGKVGGGRGRAGANISDEI